MSDSREALIAALGVELPDELLTLALTHRSYAYEHGGLPTNERLEFLGDAVLGLTITDELFHRHPDRPEGDLAKLRASIVNTQALADVARTLTDSGLGVYLLLGRGEENTGGSDKSSILADTMESLLGAVYLHHGIDTAREVILRLFGTPARHRTDAGRRSRLEDQPAGADRGARTWRAGLSGHVDGPRPRQGVHRDGDRDGHRVRVWCRAVQERGRAEGRRRGVERPRQCLSCRRSRPSGADWPPMSRAERSPPFTFTIRGPCAGTRPAQPT